MAASIIIFREEVCSRSLSLTASERALLTGVLTGPLMETAYAVWLDYGRRKRPCATEIMAAVLAAQISAEPDLGRRALFEGDAGKRLRLRIQRVCRTLLPDPNYSKQQETWRAALDKVFCECGQRLLVFVPGTLALCGVCGPWTH